MCVVTSDSMKLIKKNKKKLVATDIHKPSTLDQRTLDADDLWLVSCRSVSSTDSVDEHILGGRAKGSADSLVREVDAAIVGGGEMVDLGAGVIIPFRLGDLDMYLPLTALGSCRGNREVYFMSWMVLRCSTIVLMVGLSDGSTWRHR